jgi:hypothetical protein
VTTADKASGVNAWRAFLPEKLRSARSLPAALCVRLQLPCGADVPAEHDSLRRFGPIGYLGVSGAVSVERRTPTVRTDLGG